MKLPKISNHWDKFYKDNRIKKNSPFANFTLKKIVKFNNILDIGCGDGRDAFFFKDYFKQVSAIDKSLVVIKKNNENKKKNKIKNINFLKTNIAESRFLHKKKYENLYARFFIHAINYKEQLFFLKNLKKISNLNSLIFLEFRTTKDPTFKYGKKISKYERIYGHYRRFIDVNEFKDILKSQKFKIIYFKSGYNFSIFRNQKPHLARFIIRNI